MAVPTPGTAGSPVKTFSPPAAGTTAQVPAPHTAANDFVIVALGKEINATVTGLPAGFVELGTPVATTGNVFQHHLFGAIAAGDDFGTTYDFTWTGSAPYIEGVAMPISGASTFYEAATGASRSSSGAVTPAVNLTTLGTDRLVVFSGYNYNGGNWGTYTSPFTERYDGGTCLCVATAPFASAGATGNITATCSASEYESARMVAILPFVAPTFSKAPGFMPLLLG